MPGGVAEVRRALVLAGGGVAGIAWELCVLMGVMDVDPALGAAVLASDLVVGTSAGSSVGAQMTSGTSLLDLYAAQLAPRSAEIQVDIDLERFAAELQAATAGATSLADVRRRIGAFALAADTVPEDDRRAVMAARLPNHDWPERDLRIVAVDATTGQRVVFTRESGVGLVDAVAASCAVPGVWPPMTVAGTRYVDGGVWSGANADLAAGADRVLVLTPTLPDGQSCWAARWPTSCASSVPRGSTSSTPRPPRSRRSAPTRSRQAPAYRRRTPVARWAGRRRRPWRPCLTPETGCPPRPRTGRQRGCWVSSRKRNTSVSSTPGNTPGGIAASRCECTRALGQARPAQCAVSSAGGTLQQLGSGQRDAERCVVSRPRIHLTCL